MRSTATLPSTSTELMVRGSSMSGHSMSWNSAVALKASAAERLPSRRPYDTNVPTDRWHR